MSVDFLGVYAILHALFFILAAHIFFRFSQDIATKLEYNSFRFLVCAYLFYLPVSVAATFLEYGLAHLPRWLTYLVWICVIFTVILLGLSLYMFTVFHCARELADRRWFTPVSCLPVGAAAIFMAVSARNGCVISLTPDNHVVYGPAYRILPIITMLYFLALLAYIIVKHAKSRSYSGRRQFRAQIAAILFIFASSGVDMCCYDSHMTILPAAILIAIVFIYFNMQDSGIYTDALTRMNNRRKANEYLEACLQEASEDAFYLYMCDVDFFKRINDQYGHNEGDHALTLVAGALKQAVSRHGGFAARLGGDEFLLAWSPQRDRLGETSPEALIVDVQRALAEQCAEAQTPYSLTCSLGYARCADPGRQLPDYIREADEMLYERKREFHSRAEKARGAPSRGVNYGSLR